MNIERDYVPYDPYIPHTEEEIREWNEQHKKFEQEKEELANAQIFYHPMWNTTYCPGHYDEPLKERFYKVRYVSRKTGKLLKTEELKYIPENSIEE